jgi:hypothetical protein
MKRKGGVGHSASRHQWTSTVRKVANLGVHFAMVIASPNLTVSTLSLTNLTQKGSFPGRIRIPLLYISTTVASHFSSAPVLYFLMLAGNVIVLIMMSCVQIYELLFALD